MNRATLQAENEQLRRQVANLQAQRDSLQAAVAFYGQEEHYPEYYAGAPSVVLHDAGLCARGVLLHALELQAIEYARTQIEEDCIKLQRALDSGRLF